MLMTIISKPVSKSFNKVNCFLRIPKVPSTYVMLPLEMSAIESRFQRRRN